MSVNRVMKVVWMRLISILIIILIPSILYIIYSNFSQKIHKNSQEDIFYRTFLEANDNLTWTEFKNYWLNYPNISKKIYLLLNKNINESVNFLTYILPRTKIVAKNIKELKRYISEQSNIYGIDFYYEKLFNENFSKIESKLEVNQIVIYPLFNTDLLEQLIPDENDRRTFLYQAFVLNSRALDFKSGRIVYGLKGAELFLEQLYIFANLMSKAYYHNDKYYYIISYLQWLKSIFPHISKDMMHLFRNYTNYSIIKIYFTSRDLTLYYALKYHISYEDSLEFLNDPLLRSVACPTIKFYIPYPASDVLHDEIAIPLPAYLISTLKDDVYFGDPIILTGQFVLPFSKESALKDGVDVLVVEYNRLIILYDVRTGAIIRVAEK